MRFLFIRAEKAKYPLTVLCRLLEVSRSGYYAFEKRGPSKRASADKELTIQIQEVHQKSRQTYGSPRVHRELREGRRNRVGRKRVARLMRSAGIVGRCRSAQVLSHHQFQSRTAGGRESARPPVRDE